MNIHILLVSLFCNAYVALNYFFVIIFLLILYTFVTYCCDLTVYCNSAHSMMNSIVSLTCVDNGSVNVYICVCVCARARALPHLSNCTFPSRTLVIPAIHGLIFMLLV